MKALVTGATGLLGNNLVRLLLEEGTDVRAMSTSATTSRALWDLNVERVDADIRDREAVARATRGVDAVFHCAGLVSLGWSHRAEHEAINFGGTRNVADALRDRDVRLVFVSSVNALGIAWPDRIGNEDDFDPGITACPYVTSKRAAGQYVDQLVKDGSLDAVTVYPGFFLGPWDWKPSSGQLLLGIAQHYSPWVPTGGSSLVDARDVAWGAASAARRGKTGRGYILAGHNLTYREIWRLVAKCVGTHRPILPVGPLALVLGGWGSALIKRFTGHEPLVNSAALRIANMRIWFSSQRAIDELGYRIRPVEQTVQDACEWLLEHHFPSQLDRSEPLEDDPLQMGKSA